MDNYTDWDKGSQYLADDAVPDSCCIHKTKDCGANRLSHPNGGIYTKVRDRLIRFTNGRVYTEMRETDSIVNGSTLG